MNWSIDRPQSNTGQGHGSGPVLPLFVVLSLVMHGLLLWSSARPVAKAPLLPRSSGHVIVARLLAPLGSRPAEPLELREANSTNVGAVKADAKRGPAQPKFEDGALNGADFPSPPVVGAATGEPTETAVNSAVDADYLPRSALTRGPEPTAPVVLAFPKGWKGLGRYSAKFALYIDDSGVVQRIERVDTPDFPGTLEKVVRESFMGVLFKPGELDGRAVHARMLIEVSFDAESRAARQ